MKSVHIGIIGFGTVGKGVYNLLAKNASLIEKRSGISIKIKKICDLDTAMVTSYAKEIEVTDSWQEVVKDKEIDIIIELIGGINPAKEIVLEAMKNQKSVVTANKKLLAESGMEIFELANSSSAKLGFEASVAGGIPCIDSLKNGLVGNRIKSVIGILNGTTNYILTKMTESPEPFDKVLKTAQDLGFAEADPTFDIEGFDAGHKIALLSMIAYNKSVDFSSISIEGITKIDAIDISFAKDMGYIIKLLGISKEIDGTLDIRVHPTMLPEKHPLAAVNDEFNAVMFDGDMTDPILLYGKGAGSYPTASAVVSDIVDIAIKESIEEQSITLLEKSEYVTPNDRISRYYIRIYTDDKSGILSKISGVLGDHNISISSVMQKESDSEYIPLIIMTHEAKEDSINDSIKEINNFDFIRQDVMVIRVED